jgi:hypothetical protein
MKDIQARTKQYAEEIEKTIQVNGKNIMNGMSVYGIAGTSSYVVEA